MNPMLKWIGGATAALILVLGGATLAGGMLGNDATPVPERSLEDAIPVDEAAMAGGEAASADAAQPGRADGEAALRDAAAEKDERFVIKRILPIDGPIKYGEWHWDAEGVPDGPLIVTVDLEARVVSVFRGGYEIGATAAMLGTDEHPTPLGTFPILRKQRHNVSEKYGNAPMPWSMFLTHDGIAIHGGSEVENGYASHGCIAVPDDFASRLFDIAKHGDKVIITRGETIGMGDSII